MKIGIFGGTFNPVHCGHLSAAHAARRSHRLDRVLLVPSGTPPHKRRLESLAPAADRLAMVRLAVRGEDGLEACDVEVFRAGTSFTSETLAILAAAHPGAELFLLLGADVLRDLGRWKDIERIAELARVVLVNRGCEHGELRPAAFPRLRADVLARWEQDRVTMEPVEASSTAIRQAIALGGDVAAVLPAAVAAYARAGQLYT